MNIVALDLTKNPELAALVSDKEPGDWIELRASIKALDDQTVTVRLESCDDAEKPESDEEEDDDLDNELEPAKKDEPAPAKPGKSLAQKLASSY